MNKALLIWNLVLTVLLVGMVLNGCGSQYDFSAEIRTNRQVLEQLADLANANREAINSNNQAILANKVKIETYTNATEASLNALGASLTQYIEQYVQAYVDQVTSSQ